MGWFWCVGLCQCVVVWVEIGLLVCDFGLLCWLIVMLFVFEVFCLDWLVEVVVVGLLYFELIDWVLVIFVGIGLVVVVVLFIVLIGIVGLMEVVLQFLMLGEMVLLGLCLVVLCLSGVDLMVLFWVVVGLGSQVELFMWVDLVICGGGYGMVVKMLLVGVFMVVVFGGGDQWEIVNWVVWQGSVVLIWLLIVDVLVVVVNEVLLLLRFWEVVWWVVVSVVGVVDLVWVCYDVFVLVGQCVGYVGWCVVDGVL